MQGMFAIFVFFPETPAPKNNRFRGTLKIRSVMYARRNMYLGAEEKMFLKAARIILVEDYILPCTPLSAKKKPENEAPDPSDLLAKNNLVRTT